MVVRSKQQDPIPYELLIITFPSWQAGEPVLMCAVPGYDASNRVDDLAAHLNKQMTSIAIGSSEGFDQVCE